MNGKSQSMISIAQVDFHVHPTPICTRAEAASDDGQCNRL